MSSQSPENDPLRSLRDVVEDLARRFGAIEARLDRLETPRPESSETFLVAEVVDSSGPESAETPTPSVAPSEAPCPPPKGQPPHESIPTQAASESPFEQELVVNIRDRLALLLPGKDESWETWLGSRGLAIMGSIVIVLAIAFAVPLAWRYFETPAWVKVLGFHLLGVGFLAGGHFLNQKKLKLLSNCLAGLGIFSLYAIAFGALHLYEIWGENIAFAECAAITLLAIAISIRANSVTIVLLGALGGYLTPLVTSSGIDNYIGWFVYLAFLNVALIGCAVLKKWSFLKPIAWAATALMFWIWTNNSNHFTPFLETKLWPTQWLLTLHATIFLLGSTIPPILWRRRSTQIDLSALVSSSLWFLAMTAFLFHNRTEQQLALVSWGLAILHAVLFALTYSRVGNVDRMPRVQLAISAIFFTLAVPLQLNDWAYLSAAWCVEGLILAIVGVYFRDRQMAASALVVFLLASGRMLYDYLFHDPHFVEGTGIDSQFLIISCSAILAMTAGLVFRILPRLLPREEAFDRFESIAGAMLIAIGNLAILASMTCQWDSRLILMIWTLNAAAILLLGFRLRIREVRFYAAGLAILMVGGRAMWHTNDVSDKFQLLFNERFISLAMVTLLYFVAAWLYRRLAATRSSKPMQIERLLDPIFALLGSLVMLAAFTMEIQSWFAAAINSPFPDMQMAEQATYSIGWAIYAALMVAAGFLFRYRLFRVLGLTGFLIVLAKVFFIDLAHLELLPRVLALAILGAMMLGASFLYFRFTGRVDQKE